MIHGCLQQDPIKPYIVQKASEQFLELTPYQPPHRTSRFEPLSRDEDSKVDSLNEEVKIELKPLPSNLRYTFLNSNFKFPLL